MLRTRNHTDDPATMGTRTVPGASLARGPALILGTVLLAAGLYFLYKQHGFTRLSNFPDGSAHTGGNVFLGIFGANGWTGMLTAIAGGLLLFGAAQHHLAKLMSLIVGVALAAAAAIALFNHGNVLGLPAANGWTEIGWGASALILLFNTMAPRRRRVVPATGALPEDEPLREDTAARDGEAAPEGVPVAGGSSRGSLRTRGGAARPRIRRGFIGRGSRAEPARAADPEA